MTTEEFTERMRMAKALKSSLIRSLGHEGGARWCEHLATQIRRDAERVQRPIEVFPEARV